MKSLIKSITFIAFIICSLCSIGRWFVKPEHQLTIDGTMVVSFWVLIISLLIEIKIDA